MKQIALLALASILLPAAADARRTSRHILLKGTLSRDGSFSFPAHNRRADQHWRQRSDGRIQRHPAANEMKPTRIEINSAVAVTMPDGRLRIMSVGELQKEQRSYASAHLSNQANRRARADARPSSGFGACRLNKGPAEIKGKDLVQGGEQGALRSFLAKKLGIQANPYDRRLKIPEIARVRLELPANSVQQGTLEAGTAKWPHVMSLKRATGHTGGLYNGRPISQWETFVKLDPYKKAGDGSPLYQLGLNAFASEFSSGTGGTQRFLSNKRFTPIELQTGVLTTLTDGLVGALQASQTK